MIIGISLVSSAVRDCHSRPQEKYSREYSETDLEQDFVISFLCPFSFSELAKSGLKMRPRKCMIGR